MCEYYHASATPLEPGTVLESRFISKKLKFQFDALASALKEDHLVLKSLLLADFWHQSGKPTLAFPLKEAVLEHIRAKEFPQHPSRHHCVFLCPTRDDIVRFRETVVRQNNDRSHLYVCTVEEEAIAKLFEADMSFVGSSNVLAPIRDQLGYLVDRARQYWQGRKSDNPAMEVLAPIGAVKVTARADW
jgi:hypothetical protein